MGQPSSHGSAVEDAKQPEPSLEDEDIHLGSESQEEDAKIQDGEVGTVPNEEAKDAVSDNSARESSSVEPSENGEVEVKVEVEAKASFSSYSDNSFRSDDLVEGGTNVAPWSDIEELNTKGLTRQLDWSRCR